MIATKNSLRVSTAACHLRAWRLWILPRSLTIPGPSEPRLVSLDPGLSRICRELAMTRNSLKRGWWMTISTNRFKRSFLLTAEVSLPEVHRLPSQRDLILKRITRARSVCGTTVQTCRSMILFRQFAKLNFLPTPPVWIRFANWILKRSRETNITSLKSWVKADMESSLKRIKWHSIVPLRSRFSSRKRKRALSQKAPVSQERVPENYNVAATSFCMKPKLRPGYNTRTSCRCTILVLTRQASCSIR